MRAPFTQGGSFVWPTIIVSVLAFYGYLFTRPDLPTKRPQDPADAADSVVSAVGESEVQTASVRSWEDPLGNQYLEKVQDDDFQTTSRISSSELGISKMDDVLVMPVLLPGGLTSDVQESRRRTRHAILSALTTQGYRDVHSSAIQYFKLAETKNPETGMVIPFEHFAPDHSDRFYDSEDFPQFRNVVVCWLDQGQLGGQPLSSIHRLLDAIIPRDTTEALEDAHHWRARVIGPWGSTCLLNMALEWKRDPTAKERFQDLAARIACATENAIWRRLNENQFDSSRYSATIQRLNSEYLDRPELAQRGKSAEEYIFDEIQKAKDYRAVFYSPTATIHPEFLKGRADEVQEGVSIKGALRDFLAIGKDGNGPLKMIRTIGTDENLVRSLRNELELRSRWPTKCRRPDSEHADGCVVLITERDTLYGRLFPMIMAHALKDRHTFQYFETRTQTARKPASSASESLRQLETYDQSMPGIQLEFNKNGHVNVELASRHYRGIRVPTIEFKTSPIQGFWELSEFDPNQPGSVQGTGATLNIRGSPGQLAGMWQLPSPMVTYKYFQGTDGLGAATGDSSKSSEPGSDAAQGYEPTGTAQLDYLRRLEAELVELDRQQRWNGGRGIVAIGVVGSDVYDKLLVLRTLAGRFSRAVFFTTDLDANFFRPSELRYTRNLIVASHFGLELHPSLQRDVPPFRDTYQTAVFFSTLVALKDRRVENALAGRRNDGDELWQNHRAAKDDPLWRQRGKRSEDSKYIQPLVFEISRDGAYQLTKTETPRTPMTGEMPPKRSPNTPLTQLVQPPSDRDTRVWKKRDIASIALLLGSIFALALYHLSAVRHRVLEAWRLLRTSGRWFYCSILNRRTLSQDERPTIEQLCISLGLIFCVVGAIALPVLIWYSHNLEGGEPFALTAGISSWPTIVLRFSAVVLVLLFVLHGSNQLIQQDREQYRLIFAHRRQPNAFFPLVRVIKSLFANFLQLLTGNTDALSARWSDAKNRVRWLLRTTLVREKKQYDECQIGALFAHFQKQSAFGRRMGRTIAMALLYMCFALTAFSVFDAWPSSSVRGGLNGWLDWLSLRLSVPATVFLVFFVVDANMTCQRFVRAFRETQFSWPPCAIAYAKHSLLPGLDRMTEECLAIDIAAKRTRLVGSLLYYPFFVLLIMAVSRQRFFERLDMPPVLLVVIGLMFIILIVHSLILRREASRLRTEAVKRLHALTARVAANGNGYEEKQISLAIDAVAAERRGAFCPFSDDILFRALAIPFGGTGGLLLLQHLLS